MKKRLFFVVFLLFIVLGFVSANGTEEQSNQTESSFRVISLAPNVTEIICALGSQENLVARTDYCNYPESVSNIQSIGDMYDPNLELIISLQPDAVISTSIVSPSVVEQLNNYGIKTYQFFHEYEGLDGTITLIREIGDVIGKTNEANSLINELNTKKLLVENKLNKLNLSNKKKCAVIITWGEWGDYAATGDTFIDDMINIAGASNIAHDATYWAISKELLITTDPDFIFITDTSNYYTDDMVMHFKTTAPYSNLSASKNNNVYVLNSDAVSRQSYRLYDILEEIAHIMYPEAF